MKLAIYGRRFDPEFTQEVSKLFDALVRRGIQFMIHEGFARFLADKISLPQSIEQFTNYEEMRSATHLISIGGDGTLLDTVAFIRDRKVPVLGVNTGRLGFLSNASLDEVESAIESLVNGNYELDQRSLLEVKSEFHDFDGFPFALNEVTILNKGRSSMVTIHAYVNDLFVCTYWADGLIVSTPTGSTAYSLSCGGPIVMPGSNNILLTPVAPHNLTVRPFVIPNSSRVRLRAEGRDPEFVLTLDSRSFELQRDHEVELVRAPFQLNLVQLEGQNFFNTIRNKMGWGLDRRN